MTEADWLTGTDLTALVRFATDFLSARRERLLAVGFCRAVEHLINHSELIEALKVIEWYADGRDSIPLEKARQRCRIVITNDAYSRQVSRQGSGSGRWARTGVGGGSRQQSVAGGPKWGLTPQARQCKRSHRNGLLVPVPSDHSPPRWSSKRASCGQWW